MNNFAAYVDLDVHKDTITVAIAAAKRSGKVRSLRAQTRSVQAAFKKQKNQRSIQKRINFAQDIPSRGLTNTEGVPCMLTTKDPLCRLMLSN